MGAISTAFSGNWYSIVGSVAEARAELNRINAKSDRVRISAINDLEVMMYVGTP